MSIWFPSPAAFDDLTITEIEDGFEFSAPDDSECAVWLGHYNSTEELHEEFSAAIIEALTNYIDSVENGSQEQDTQRSEQA